MEDFIKKKFIRGSISQEVLNEMYFGQSLTGYQIAKKLGCCKDTVWRNLKKYGIKARTPWALYSNVPSREELLVWYIDNKLSTWKIEEKYGYCRSTVYRKLKEYDIKSRDRARAHILFPRKNFSGDSVEKAYLIGFRIGDLGVRRIYPNSRTICMASGSTVPEQIDLIKSLFEKYGKVWIKKARFGNVNIQVNLNDSFDFLLSKNVPDWISIKKEYFFSFLAGFSDAEGSYGIYSKKAKFQLGNCRKDILLFIRDKLNQFGIVCKGPYASFPSRYISSLGHKNYFQICVNRKGSLLQLFKALKPFIQHINKIKDLNKAKNNVLGRMKTDWVD